MDITAHRSGGRRRGMTTCQLPLVQEFAQRSRIPWRVAMAALGLAVALTGCGGGGSDDPGDPDAGRDGRVPADAGGGEDAAADDAGAEPDRDSGARDAGYDCVATGAEECDGLDNDCDGLVDEDLGVEVTDARTGEVVTEAQACDRADDDDECERGVFVCDSGSRVCDEPDGRDPDTAEGGAEICDEIDNDCDGEVDEGLGVGEPCDGDDDDLCADGVYECLGGAVVCTDDEESHVEVCNGEDDDCDGEVDEGVEPMGSCESESGCATGELVCTDGEFACDAEEIEKVLFVRDQDGDGYGVEGDTRSLCPGDHDGWIQADESAGRDCCDTDSGAYEGRTGWFTGPTDCGHYDYDCDGYERRRIKDHPDWPYAQCQSVVAACNEGQGWEVPACGDPCTPGCGGACWYVYEWTGIGGCDPQTAYVQVECN